MLEDRLNYAAPEIREVYDRRRFDEKESDLKIIPEFIEERDNCRIYRGLEAEEYTKYIEKVHSIEAKEAFEMVLKVALAIKEAGGRALIVGGAVRDEVLGIAAKDFDIEIYGLDAETVERIISKYGSVKDVGKAFGILKLQHKGGIELDISLPRIDSKIGEGHRGFEVKVDPYMSIAEAAKRRDFTFNALSKDPLTGEIFDPYGGVDDLKEHILSVTDEERFRDDPLRLLRGAQFTGRFGLQADLKTLEIFRSMVPELAEISKERIREEWEKLLLRSKKPSKGLNLLREIGAVEQYYPELQAMIGCEQEFEWHPEGDVWVHTLLVVDGAKEIVDMNNLKGETARVVMLAALCHDLGKPETTEFKDGRIKSHSHDIKGMEPSVKFLERIGTRIKDIEKVVNLVREHIWPTVNYLHRKDDSKNKGTIKDGAFRRLAKRLYPATIEELSYVVEADCKGVGPFLDPQNPQQFLLKTVEAYGFEAGRWLRQRAEEIGVYREPPRPFITGKELIALGYKPSNREGERFGDVMQLADECRDLVGMPKEQLMDILEKTNKTVAEASARLRDFLDKNSNPFIV